MPQLKSLLFSLRGCHLLAMFARTPVAKEFRRWVLDVIEKYGDQFPAEHPASITLTPPCPYCTDTQMRPLEEAIKTFS